MKAFDCLMIKKIVKMSILYTVLLFLSFPIYGQVPEQQKEFIEAVSKAILAYKEARNELQEWSVRDERKESLKSVLAGEYRIKDWIGTVKSLRTNSSGDASLRIEIAPNVSIKTFSDDTLIMKGSDLYKLLMNLSRGMSVKFSGQFFPNDKDYIEEASLTMGGGMREPHYVFRFSDVQAQ